MNSDRQNKQWLDNWLVIKDIFNVISFSEKRKRLRLRTFVFQLCVIFGMSCFVIFRDILNLPFVFLSVVLGALLTTFFYHRLLKNLSFSVRSDLRKLFTLILVGPTAVLGFLVAQSFSTIIFSDQLREELNAEKEEQLTSLNNELKAIYGIDETTEKLNIALTNRNEFLEPLKGVSEQFDLYQAQLKKEDTLLVKLKTAYEDKRRELAILLKRRPEFRETISDFKSSVVIYDTGKQKADADFRRFFKLFGEVMSIERDSVRENGILTKTLIRQQLKVNRLREDVDATFEKKEYYQEIDSLYQVAQNNKLRADSEFKTAFSEDSLLIVSEQASTYKKAIMLKSNIGNGVDSYLPLLFDVLLIFLFGLPLILVYNFRDSQYNLLLNDLKWKSKLRRKQDYSVLEPNELERLEYINRIVPDSATYYLIANAYLEINEVDKALQVYKHMQEIYPDDELVNIKIDEVYKSQSGSRRELQAANHSHQLSEEVVFNANLSKRFKLMNVEIANIASFERVSWNPQPQINIMLGKNGYGKSYLLRLLISMLQNEEEVVSEYSFKKTGSASTQLSCNDQLRFIKSDGLFLDSTVGKVPVLAISDQRFVDKSISQISFSGADYLELPENGAYHFLNEKPFDSTIQEFLYSLCLEYYKKDKSFPAKRFKMLTQVVEELTGDVFEFVSITEKGSSRFILNVKLEGSKKILPIQKASQGTLSILTIFGLIYNYLKSLPKQLSAAGEKLVTTEKYAIVVIDEIDAHLHPSWQRKIVGLLRTTFSNTQFFITGHNPALVAGCYENEVSVLRKNDLSSGFELVQLQQDFVGISTEKIYQTVFEVEKMDDEFIKYASLKAAGVDFKDDIVDLNNRELLNTADQFKLNELNRKQHFINKVSIDGEESGSFKKNKEVLQLRSRIKELEREIKKRDAEG